MRWWQSPAAHMAAIGGVAFAATALWGSALFEPRPRIVVEEHRLQLMVQGFAADQMRPPTQQEREQMLELLIDEEVLFNYALTLGMDEHPAAERRLAQIARFVEANPHDATDAELAASAMELGLHHGDLVVRRVLVDSARRLIRSVVLLQEPRPELVDEYLATHRDELSRPARTRLSHLLVNGFKWPDTERRARALLERLRAEALDFEAALALSDDGLVPSELPLLTEGALATKLGPDFAAAAIQAPTGEWMGPIASLYGHHLIYVHERHDAFLPPREEIEDRVKQRVLHQMADEWLGLRLRELRLEYEIVTPASAS